MAQFYNYILCKKKKIVRDIKQIGDRTSQKTVEPKPEVKVSRFKNALKLHASYTLLRKQLPGRFKDALFRLKLLMPLREIPPLKIAFGENRGGKTTM